MSKPNCWKCKHRAGVPGSAHSRRVHPATKRGDENPMADLLSLFGKRAGVVIDASAAEELGIVGHVQGIRNGWFNWPYNFDPTWLDACDGFASKAEGKDEDIQRERAK